MAGTDDPADPALYDEAPCGLLVTSRARISAEASVPGVTAFNSSSFACVKASSDFRV